MYINLENEALKNNFAQLINNAKNYSENLDTEFTKYKMLNLSNNN